MKKAVAANGEPYAGYRHLSEASVEVLSHGDSRSFILPDNGQLLDSKKQTSLQLANLRMPFPACILEYQLKPDFYETSETYDSRTDSGRFNPIGTLLMVLSDETGITCSVLWKGIFKGISIWQPSRGGFRIDANSKIDIDGDLVRGEITALNVKAMHHARFQPINEFVDEIRTLCHFSMLCSCENVKVTRAFAPSPQLLKRCRERGNLAPDDYYVLDCFIGEHSDRSADGNGSHASPRFHVRRGHVRRLSNGRTTWVRQCTVGDVSNGRIDKDYNVMVRT